MPYKDREIKNQNAKIYREKNKEKLKGIQKQYNQKNPHINKISKWKERGMKLKPNEDWESIYLFYISCECCEECGVELTTEKKITSTRRCLDHDHATGFIRDILCHSCNMRRG